MTTVYFEGVLLILPTYEQIFTSIYRVIVKDARKEGRNGFALLCSLHISFHLSSECKHVY
jgi:hypothetical protein